MQKRSVWFVLARTYGMVVGIVFGGFDREVANTYQRIYLIMYIYTLLTILFMLRYCMVAWCCSLHLKKEIKNWSQKNKHIITFEFATKIIIHSHNTQKTITSSLNHRKFTIHQFLLHFILHYIICYYIMCTHHINTDRLKTNDNFLFVWQ